LYMVQGIMKPRSQHELGEKNFVEWGSPPLWRTGVITSLGVKNARVGREVFEKVHVKIPISLRLSNHSPQPNILLIQINPYQEPIVIPAQRITKSTTSPQRALQQSKVIPWPQKDQLHTRQIPSRK
jgi:hypothetical protein